MIGSVLFAGNYLHYSGAFEVFRSIARILKSQGVKTGYAYHRRRDGDIIPDLSMFDSLHFIDEEKFGDNREELGREFSDVANLYEVIHASLLPLQWRFALKKRLNIPCIETYHSADGWKRCWNQYRIRLEGGVEKPPDATISVSNGLAELIRSDSGIEAKRIYNGVAIPESPGPGGPYVTYCGRIAHDKGLDDWLKIAVRIKNQLSSAKFQWVGDTSPMYDKFAFRCLQAGCPWLEVTGFTEDPSRFYQRAGVLLLTSRSEGLPMVILEAMAHGVPSVAYDIGDIRETTAELVYDAGQAEASALRWLTCGCAGKRQAIRAIAQDTFSAERMASEYRGVYEQCCLSLV